MIRFGPPGKVRRRPPPSVTPPDPYPTTGDWIFGTKTGSAGSVMPYAFFIPVGAAPDAAMKQLVVWIHAVDAKGSNIAQVMATDVPQVVTANKQVFPHYCLAMQIPSQDGLAGGAGWEYRQSLGQLIATLTAQYTIDPSRRHLTGFSTGGIYSYDMPSTFPNLFASITPVGGAMHVFHYGNPANRAVPVQLADHQACYDDFITRNTTLAVCHVIGSADDAGFVTRTNDMFTRWGVLGYASTTSASDAGITTDMLRIKSVWSGGTHGGAMNGQHFSLGNTAYWAWLAAQVRA
jgi:predicted esterase